MEQDAGFHGDDASDSSLEAWLARLGADFDDDDDDDDLLEKNGTWPDSDEAFVQRFNVRHRLASAT